MCMCRSCNGGKTTFHMPAKHRSRPSPFLRMDPVIELQVTGSDQLMVAYGVGTMHAQLCPKGLEDNVPVLGADSGSDYSLKLPLSLPRSII